MTYINRAPVATQLGHVRTTFLKKEIYSQYCRVRLVLSLQMYADI